MRDVDLNLLTIFDTIMTEGSVTKASERLAMTQSAVSNAVARMRVEWKDPLFVKDGRGIRPSPRASAIWREISEPLAAIRQVINPPEFDPATTARRFRLAVTDYVTYPMWPLLRNLLEVRGPAIDILAVPWKVHNTREQLLDNEIDLALGVMSLPGDEFKQCWAFDAPYVCAMRRSHPLASRPLTLDRFLCADHLLVSLSGDPIGKVDDLLAQQGLKRRVAMTVNNFYGLPDLLVASNLICVVSESVLRNHPLREQIYTTAPPIHVPTSSCNMAWHIRHDRDPGHRWLRGVLSELCLSIWGPQRNPT